MKIFIVYANAGAGHKKAAMAIKEALDKRNNSLEAVLIDVLDYTNSFFKISYPGIYIFAITHIPFIWGFFYYLLDNKIVYAIVSGFRYLINKINAKKFGQFVIKENPDVIISTHFLPTYIVSNLKKKGLFSGKLVTVITDFMPHTFWLGEKTDKYVVAANDTKLNLIARGVDAEKIEVTGIPISEVFYQHKDKEYIRRILRIEEKPFTILAVSGGFGIGPMEEIADSLNTLDEDIRNQIQVIVVCGKNGKLFTKLHSEKAKYRILLKVYGFVDNMDELMQISDVIITKSGGLTVSECLAKSLPMIIVAPIPGQERYNYNMLVKNNACLGIRDAKEAKEKVEFIFKNPEKFARIKKNIKNIAVDFSAKKIIELAIKK